ncbi:hypothetical protein DL89DRAFT_290946 [Linderina pennispora]|uniref:t-SNARE coiled-coil homology domain-containing protein n=1 Tax=Linderina pennispora TaxID=61395 RepID=A0A1Y1WJD8_9FUNG|nr:uncharacterized protein DL89DRAFT_290946 [Linderina pennispora]ORX73214.1 hypothetical protein DL89DRAFT_290946 [Linderina pennispora]
MQLSQQPFEDIPYLSTPAVHTSQRNGLYSGNGHSGNAGQDHRLRSKISMLKEVSISIGDEIRDQNKFLETMGQDMEGMGGRLQATMKRFYEMWARQGCGPFFYITLFGLGVLTLLYFYLKMR